ncbi:serine hydrolase [Catovirus CTV1]|uniref:Serine hydrolase n=1 Tax=Catovirus CTV1 TaxID=1977631 RepID=A0A1V0S8U1_9VIRU|nr:serine hydrolase [Catovirus CTV1]
MKILCLHGFRSNGSLLYKSINSLASKLKKHNILLDFVDSKTKHPESNNDIDYRQWWNTSKEGLFNEKTYDTLYESIEQIYDICSKDNYDGIIGYSQGSVMVQILLYLMIYPDLFEAKYKKFKFDFKFAILASTFKITDTSLMHLYEKKLIIPVLNVYGKNDTLVPYTVSRELDNISVNCNSFCHDGKHYIPTTKNFYDFLIQWFKSEKLFNF